MAQYLIADSHSHIFPQKIAEKASKSIGDFYDTENKNPSAAPEILLEKDKAAGISKILVCSSAVVAHQVEGINSFISEQCQLHPEFLGLGTLHPDYENYSEELDRIVSLGLHGLKFHPDFQHFDIDDPRMDKIYEKASKLGLVILFHMGDDRTDYSSPLRLARVVDKYPDLKVIAAHFGGYRAWDKVKNIRKSENVFFDTSSSLEFLPKETALDLIDHFGYKQFMFGVDFPMWDPKEELEKYFSLGLSEEINQAILAENFKRLFNIEF